MNLPHRPRKSDGPAAEATADGATRAADDTPRGHGSHQVTAATIDESDRPGKLEAADIDEEALLAEFEAEKPARVLTGIPGMISTVFAIALSLYALYWVFNPLPRQVYLPTFLSVGLFLTFLTYRGWGRSDKAKASGKPDHPNVLDWVLALLSLVPAVYIVSDWQAFFRRAITPNWASTHPSALWLAK